MDAAMDLLVTEERYRSVLAHVPSSVAVVAAVADGVPRGLSVATFVPVSIDPPLIGVFVGRRSTSWPYISAVGAFTVSVLAAGQSDLARQFAVSRGDKFANVAWRAAPSGHPVLIGAVAWVDGTIRSQTQAGDHLFVLADVADLAVESGGPPLLHHRSGYRRARDLDPS
jgi:3-hydroxy-9,10-secoandrosta-1,3,5(10)-triene-9,17-dione monooxygenase reductase component